MCDQVVCEIPDECVQQSNINPCEPVPAANCGNFCPPQCNPCEAPSSYTPCPPSQPCNCRCDCGDYSSCCYQQPARTLPIRQPNGIVIANVPMQTDTIYQRSYVGNCGDCFRAKPILPCNNLTRDRCPMEKCTIQKLSYMPHAGARPALPIKPKENYLNFRGPLYALSSQKHDFVPKGYCKRQPILPCNGIYKPVDPLEKCTVNRLSFMPIDVCKNPPPKAIVQGFSIDRHTGPGEKCTIQKLSYMPLCLPPKERLPWAEIKRNPPPKYDNLCTTYNLSYIPNCNTGRIAPIYPVNGLNQFGCERNDGNTIYKLSFVPNDARCCKPNPIYPMNGLERFSGPMEKCTIQKLSYQPNSCVPRTAPIKPKENCIKPSGAMYFMTTQKHDFVPKPVCRARPFIQGSAICRPTEGLEKCTINRLSYMPVNVCEHPRPNPIIPTLGICRPAAPIEQCTTYKLSYLPNCIPAKEHLPWAHASSYVKPTSPIEKCTVQRLSYVAPGLFNKCGACCNQSGNNSAFPKAGIC